MRRTPWSASSFRTQILVSTVCLVGFSMVLLALGVQLVLAGFVSHNVDSVLHSRADSLVTAIEESTSAGREVPDEAIEPGVLVYGVDAQVISGVVAPSLSDEAQKLSAVTRPTTTDVGDDYRLYATPFTIRGDRSGVIVVSERLAPYEQTESYALLASVVLGLIVTAAAGFVVRWVTHRALAPVAMMAERAADWSEHDHSRRFDLGEPTNEITALGATLDQLLERVSMAIRAEQRLTSELAHELRTPLTAIQGAADLALLRGGHSPSAQQDLQQVADSSRAMATTITALLELARTGAPGAATAELATVVSGALAEHPSTVIRTELDGHGHVRLASPAQLSARALSPLIENAVRHAHGQVTITCRVRPSSVDLVVDDDGPGITATEGEDLFAPGASARPGGTGLGLAIARRTARSLGGDVITEDTEVGARFVLSLPRL
ncbi:putative Integral membrane sensor signal transduction histidine kinase [metagenome]|uniref:histidine kinase n=1 Tax=metagenome TaxID=256318 RepID=A0A2P2BZ16_9ZZZZ